MIDFIFSAWGVATLAIAFGLAGFAYGASKLAAIHQAGCDIEALKRRVRPPATDRRLRPPAQPPPNSPHGAVMTHLVEKVARAIYDDMEGPVANQDFMRQTRQWELAQRLARAALAAIEAEGFVLTRPGMSSYTSDRVFDGTRQMSHDDAAKHVGRVNAMIEAGRIREDGK